MSTQSLQGGPLKCVRCSYEWMPRRDVLPMRCPKCRSLRWNDAHLCVECKRCGNKWNSHDGHPLRCPKCGSYKWDQPPSVYHCKQCGNDWVAKGSKLPSRCPACFSRAWDREPIVVVETVPVASPELETLVRESYRKGKGCVQISLDTGLPYSKVREIISRDGSVQIRT